MDVKITPKKLKGTLEVPLSKSHAHRVLIAQKIAAMQSGIQNDDEIPTFSLDIEATKDCLAQMDQEMPYLDCQESGSTLRFMLPVTMAIKDEAIFMGSGKLPSRPISPLREAMEEHGCNFRMANNEQSPADEPQEICKVMGSLLPGDFYLAGNISSQFITGLLMALPILSGDSRLELTTKLESAGYVDLTLDVLRDFGINIDVSENEHGFPIYEIAGDQQYVCPDHITIQRDWSSAAFWLACGALGGNITLKGLDLSSSQRDKEIVNILEAMGAHIERGKDTLKCSGKGLKAAEVDVSQTPDLVPVLASVMSLAEGSSMITNAGRLKIKESDRLHTVFDFLSKLGADITDGGDGLSITGAKKLSGGTVSGHNDHRIVMAAAVASCGCKSPVTICGVEAVRKSYPDFFEDFTALGGKVNEVEQ